MRTKTDRGNWKGNKALPRRADRRKGKGLTARAAARPCASQPEAAVGLGLRDMKTQQEDGKMDMLEGMRLALGSALVAAGLYAVLALPGLVSDQDSVVPARQVQEARR